MVIPHAHAPIVALARAYGWAVVGEQHRLIAIDFAGVPDGLWAVRGVEVFNHTDLIRGLFCAALRCRSLQFPTQARCLGTDPNRVGAVFTGKLNGCDCASHKLVSIASAVLLGNHFVETPIPSGGRDAKFRVSTNCQ